MWFNCLWIQGSILMTVGRPIIREHKVTPAMVRRCMLTDTVFLFPLFLLLRAYLTLAFLRLLSPDLQDHPHCSPKLPFLKS